MLDLEDTSYVYSGLEELSEPSVYLFATNEYGGGSAFINDRARTYLNEPTFQKIEIHEEAGFNRLVFQDKSYYDNWYLIFRKGESDASFVKIDSLVSEPYLIKEGDIYYDDTSADLNAEYQYYIQAMFLEEYPEIGYINYAYSQPSDSIYTQDAVLSNSKSVRHSIQLYPNPTKDVLNILGTDELIIDHVAIIDLKGRVLKTSKFQSEIQTRELPTGMYLMKLYTKEGTIVMKFIKE